MKTEPPGNNKSTIIISVLTAVALILGYLPFHHRIQTERLDLEKQARLLRNLSLTGTAVVIVGKNSTILSWDGTAEDMFGFTEEEAVGANLTNLIMIPEEMKYRHEKALEYAFESADPMKPRVRTLTCYAVHRNGRPMPLMLRLHIPYEDGESILAFINKIPPSVIPGLAANKRDLENFVRRSNEAFREVQEGAPMTDGMPQDEP